MVGDGAVVSASSTKDHYAFGESNAARKAFAGRTIDADLAFLRGTKAKKIKQIQRRRT